MIVIFMQSFHMFKHVQVTMSSVLDKELDHEWVKIVEDVVHPTNVSSNEVRKTYGFLLVTLNKCNCSHVYGTPLKVILAKCLKVI